MTLPKSQVPADPKQELPADIERIARQSLGRSPVAALRQVLGLLPSPIRAQAPAPSRIADEADAEASQAGLSASSGVTGSSYGYSSGAGTTQAFGALDGSSLVDGSVGAATLEDGSISAPKIQANSISTAMLQADSVTAAKIAADAVGASEIAAGAITANDITTGTLTGITITGVNITAGGGGFDGYTVKRSDGVTIGSWTSTALATGVPIQTSSYIQAGTGLATVVVSGIGSVPITLTGGLAIDSASSPNRLYFHNGGSWHYAAADAGFTIPAHEALCPVCEKLLEPGQDLIGRGDRWQHDGALHGLWIHLACAGSPTGSLADRYDAANADDGLLRQLESKVRKLLAGRGVATSDVRPPKARAAAATPPAADELRDRFADHEARNNAVSEEVQAVAQERIARGIKPGHTRDSDGGGA